jgi:hypothetical protein
MGHISDFPSQSVSIGARQYCRCAAQQARATAPSLSSGSAASADGISCSPGSSGQKRDQAARLRLNRASPTIPKQAEIKPGRPAPTIGPGTVATATLMSMPPLKLPLPTELMV